MLGTLAHRGPDGSRLWQEDAVCLGHQMLWATPESLTETLPFVCPQTKIVLTADARLDNRAELCAALSVTETALDSELILSSYLKWGEECPRYLLGDFAFALYDPRSQSFFAARDHFGVKPFFYHCHPRLFAFASEIKALLVLPNIPNRVDETRLSDYLLLEFENKERTLYQEIQRLPPAHSLTVTRETFTKREYWTFDPERELRLKSDDEYREAFRAVLTEAVRCRLRSAYPIGSMLSGGLDSSSITCIARNLLQAAGKLPLPTFSAVYDKLTQCDERTYIQAVLDQGGLEANFVHPEAYSPLTDWEGVNWSANGWQEDEPLFNPQQMVHWPAYQASQAQGIRVLLDGFGGDTTVSYGRAYLTELAGQGRVFEFVRQARFEATRSPRSFKRTLYHWGVRPFIGSPGASIPRTVRQEHFLDLQQGFNAILSLSVIDRSSALFGLETRLPFLDKRLVEFCLALPGNQKIGPQGTRLALKRAMQGILPPLVQWRQDKGSHSAHFNYGLLGKDRELLASAIPGEPAVTRILDTQKLSQMYARYLAESSDRDGFTLWRAALLSLWLRRRRDKQGL